MNCMKINDTRSYAAFREEYPSCSINFFSLLCWEVHFNLQLSVTWNHMNLWTFPKWKCFCVRKIRLFENMFAVDEKELLPCALGERVSKEESCSQKPVWWIRLGLSFPTICHFSKVWCGEQCGVSNTAHLGIWARTWGICRSFRLFYSLHF